MKNLFLAVSILLACSVGYSATVTLTDTSSFLDIARDMNGKVMYMNQSEAIKYCANQGAHLPSARELAQLSMSLGAKGIVDSCGYDKRTCYKVDSIENADGSKDEFYFDYSGFEIPTGDLGDKWLWSSSVKSFNPDFAFVFHRHFGSIVYENGNYNNFAVLCVAGR